MEFKKYKMAMRNRISPKNRDFVIDRERAPFDDNVSNLGEQPVFSQNEFTTTPMIDPAEFPARKEYMQSYAVGGNVRQLFGIGTEINTSDKRTYLGSNIEQYHKEIKEKWMKGMSRQAIYESDPIKYKTPSAVDRALNAMKQGLSPVKISKSEIKKRGVERSAIDNKLADKIKEAYYELVNEYEEKGWQSKPNKAAVAQRVGINKTSEAVDRAVDIYDLKLGKGTSEGTEKIRKEKEKITRDKSRAAKAKDKLVLVYGKKNEIKDVLGPQELKDEYISDLKEKLKYPQSGREYRKLVEQGKVLSNSALQKKYKLGSVSQVERANKYFKQKEKLGAYKIGDTDPVRPARLRITQGGKQIRSGVKGLHFHHIFPIAGEVPTTTKEVTFINDILNAEMGGYNKQLNNIADQITDALDEEQRIGSYSNQKESLKKIDEYNLKSKEIIEGLPEKYKGLIGAREISPVFDEYGRIINLTSKNIGGDPSKGVPGKEILLENVPQKSKGYSPKSLEKKVKSISDNVLCAIGSSNTLAFRKDLTRMSTGGRIGFADGPKPGNGCIEKGKKKLEEGRIGKSELNAVEKSLTKSGKMTPAAQKFFTAAKTAARVGGKIPLELISIGFGPAGVVAGALLELATVQDDLMRGDLKEAWRNTFPGMILKGAGDLVGLDLVGSKRKDILKFAKTPEEIAAVNSMFNYLEGTEKFNEMLGDIESDAGDVSTFGQYQDPESQYMVSEASRRMYDLEDQARKLKAILDAQQKDLGTAEGQKMSIDVLRREIASRYNRALTNVSLEQFIDDEINRIYFDIQKQAAPIPDVIDPDTQFNLMNPVRQPFAGGGLSIQDKIQELLASIPGLMIADFVPISEKVQLKRLFDQFNDRYMRKAEGGRIGFKNGPEDINKSRRLFNQLLLGLAALPVVGKYLKLGRGAGKVANITINKTAGMPEFFEPLVNKVINEGIDITKKMSTQERQTVHIADIANHEVTVYRQLDTGEIDVYINGMNTIFQDPVRLLYKPGQISEEASKMSGKPVREPDEFVAQESSPAYSGSPEDYEVTSDGTFETNNFNELASDLTEVEAAVMKQPVTELQKRKKLERLKYYESKEAQQKLLDEQYGEYDDTMRDDVIDE